MMLNRKLDLDFIQQPFFSPFNFSWLGFVVFIAGLALVNMIWQQYQNKSALLAEASVNLSELNRQAPQKKLPVNIVQATISAEQKLQIETTVSVLTTPWDSLLSAIERSEIKDVALLSLEPNSKSRQVILTGEAKNLSVALSYVNQLQVQPMFDKVYLQKHNVDEANASKPIKFTVLVQWRLVDES
jgi:hypothetical protein